MGYILFILNMIILVETVKGIEKVLDIMRWYIYEKIKRKKIYRYVMVLIRARCITNDTRKNYKINLSLEVLNL